MRSRLGLTTAVLALAVGSALADHPGEFRSACQYRGDYGQYRWSVKIDSETPPRSIPTDCQLTPSQLYGWSGGRGTILSRTPRQGRENEWLRLTGRVTAVIIEGDGDIHVELVDVDGRSGAKAGVEIPAGRRWCLLRQVAFGWTEPKFPITTARRELPLTKHPAISVVGKAFWDGQYAPAAKSRGGLRRNRRTYDSTCSAWEIHPVMVLTVLRRDT
jgi:hypothetical protein